MRGAVLGLASPAPLLQRIPGVLQDDEFMRRLVSAFDEGFAPVLVTLDGLAGYVDPWLAPEDFLGWLAGWVGVELDGAWTLEQSRAAVAGAPGPPRPAASLRTRARPCFSSASSTPIPRRWTCAGSRRPSRR